MTARDLPRLVLALAASCAAGAVVALAVMGERWTRPVRPADREPTLDRHLDGR